MIFINGYPALILDGLENEIIWTDSAESKASTVYMDKRHAPSSKSLAWIQIRSRKYDSEEPISDTNRKYEYEVWMYVDIVLSPEFPVNYAYDESGDPIFDENGKADLGDWDKRSGFVKVILREHKHVLTRFASLDNVNIVHRLAGLTNTYNSIMDDPFLNMMGWDELKTFLGSEKYRLQLDYGVEYQSPEEEVLPSEYPPTHPYNCFWQQLTLLECLEDLLRNYDCRILNKTLVSPYDSEYEDEDAILTNLVWRYRRRLEYDTSLTYTRINWPVYSEEQRINEDGAHIFVPNVTTGYGTGLTLYAGSYHNPTSSTGYLSSEYNHLCALVGYSAGSNEIPANSNHLTQAVIDYVKQSHVNMSVYYAFETPHLPRSYYEEREWSTITIRASRDRQDYLVEHHPRTRNNLIPNLRNTTSFNCYVQGVVKAVSGSLLVLDNVKDLTNDIIYEGPKTLPVSFANYGGDGIAVGDIASIGITGTTPILINLDKRSAFPDEMVPPMYDGQEVAAITWSVPDWTFNPGDSYFEHPLYVSNPVSNSYLKCYNYQYASHELVDTPEGAFANIVYTAYESYTSKQSFKGPSTKNLAKVTFISPATDEEIRNYIDRVYSNIAYPSNETVRQLMVEDWKMRYQRITFYLGFYQALTTLTMYHSKFLSYPGYYNTSLHPDIIPEVFSRSGVPADDLPYTWDDESYVDSDYSSVGLGGFEGENTTIEGMLYAGYRKFLSELSVTVSLTYV